MCTNLHGVWGIFVVKDKCLLDQLVVSLQCVNFRGVRYNAFLVLFQVGQLVFQSAVHFNGYPANFLPTHKTQTAIEILQDVNNIFIIYYFLMQKYINYKWLENQYMKIATWANALPPSLP